MQKPFFIFIKSFFYTAIFATLVGCSSKVDASLSSKPATSSQIYQQRTQSHQSDLTKVLSAYHQWAGTRYRLGGTTRAGIDCSAFVRATMDNAFNLHLPRSTSEQKYVGHSIPKADLRPGDLVFFRKNHHVGVYIGNGKFVHASSSRGVTTSSLSDHYWSKNYTQSRRVL
ncbi:peptidase C40 [Vespertiliibacter pulmonis]|uniref:Lipoprotein Spr n=2 Tax=Vespertiliibacter pulmonis TaxID=1443036 RepID=A0A3N4W5K5_9PAST|nr:NlpC/P60 family protein [Vespertiliibacter pulmonis]QLB20452.1 peptidase C40 [Vespertiliibacter pulmonis]RPE86441.1 lipoprotein Spr [Vespertiliibacter pulmonis]